MFILLLLPLAFLASAVAALDVLYVRQTLNNSESTPTRREGIISAAWYPGWHSADFPLSKVSWKKYTHMTYAFAVTTPDPSVISLAASDQKLLPQFVSAAQKNGVLASLSIGGWTGSRWFSSNIKTARNRTAFVQAVTNLARQYKLNGLDFDWEYPGKQGVGCNVVDPEDTDNLLLFFRELRNNSLATNLTLSAAVFVEPWTGSDGSPSTNLTAFSQVLDYIAIMNYDVKNNPAVGAGASAPIDDSCAPAGARFGSAMTSVAAWTAAGIPANQLVLGVPAYGHSYLISSSSSSSNATTTTSMPAPYPPYNPASTPIGDRWDSPGGLDICGVMQGPSGVYTYWGLMEQGFLNQDGSVKTGIDYRFDNCSQTPFVYDPKSAVYVSYENPYSYAIKGGFIHTAGLKGFAMWEAGGDSNDALLNSILNATQNGGPPISPQVVPVQSSTASSSAIRYSYFLTALPWWRALAFVLLLRCASLI